MSSTGYTMPFVLDDEVCLKSDMEKKQFYDTAGRLNVYKVDGIFIYQKGVAVGDDGITKTPVPGFKYRIVKMGRKMEVSPSQLVSKQEFNNAIRNNAYNVST